MRKFFVALALLAAISLTVYPVVPALEAHTSAAVEVHHADYQQVAYDQSAPLIAALLSFLIPGLGQAFMGEVTRGVMIFLITVVGSIIITIILGMLLGDIGALIGNCVFFGFWVWNIYDAYQIGLKKAGGGGDEDEDEDEDEEDDEGLLRPFYTPVHHVIFE